MGATSARLGCRWIGIREGRGKSGRGGQTAVRSPTTRAVTEVATGGEEEKE